MESCHIIAAAHLRLDAQLPAKCPQKVTSGERGVGQAKDFISLFGKGFQKAAAQIAFAYSVAAVDHAAGADFAKLGEPMDEFLERRVTIRLRAAGAKGHLRCAPEGFERRGKVRVFNVHNRGSCRFWR